MALLVMNLFLTPLVAFRLQWVATRHPDWLYWFPGFWFSGFYEHLRPATHNLPLRELGVFATRALACAAGIFLLTFLPGYRGHARRVLETTPRGHRSRPPAQRPRPAPAARQLLRNPVEYAVFHSSRNHHAQLEASALSRDVWRIRRRVRSDHVRQRPLGITHSAAHALLYPGLRPARRLQRARGTQRELGLPGQRSHLRGTVSRGRAQVDAGLRHPAPVPSHGADGVRLLPAATTLFHLAWHHDFGAPDGSHVLRLRKVPFTCAHLPGKFNLVFLALVYISGFSAYSSTLSRLEASLTRNPAAIPAFFALAAALYLSLAHWERKMLGPKPALDYEDPAEPVVRTLGLTVR